MSRTFAFPSSYWGSAFYGLKGSTFNDLGYTHKTQGCQRVFKRMSSWQQYGPLGCLFWQPDISPILGCHDENFLVVNADDFDNFLVDNHKVVLLTTLWRLFDNLPLSSGRSRAEMSGSHTKLLGCAGPRGGEGDYPIYVMTIQMNDFMSQGMECISQSGYHPINIV